MKVNSKRSFQYGYPWCCWLHAAQLRLWRPNRQPRMGFYLYPTPLSRSQRRSMIRSFSKTQPACRPQTACKLNLSTFTNKPAHQSSISSSATGSGSGFVYDAKGDIITNSHVVAGSRAFEVVFASGGRQSASLVAAGADADLAVIQVEALPEGVEPLPLAASGDLAVGQFLVAIGNPFGEQGSMSLGIVSGLSRSLPSQRELTSSSSNSLPEVIQTDAPINPGNSG